MIPAHIPYVSPNRTIMVCPPVYVQSERWSNIDRHPTLKTADVRHNVGGCHNQLSCTRVPCVHHPDWNVLSIIQITFDAPSIRLQSHLPRKSWSPYGWPFSSLGRSSSDMPPHSCRQRSLLQYCPLAPWRKASLTRDVGVARIRVYALSVVGLPSRLRCNIRRWVWSKCSPSTTSHSQVVIPVWLPGSLSNQIIIGIPFPNTRVLGFGPPSSAVLIIQVVIPV